MWNKKKSNLKKERENSSNDGWNKFKKREQRDKWIIQTRKKIITSCEIDAEITSRQILKHFIKKIFWYYLKKLKIQIYYKI